MIERGKIFWGFVFTLYRVVKISMCVVKSLGFVHIPKTAGTSVTSLLSRIYGSGTFPGMTTLDYEYYSNEQLSNYNFFKGHMYRRDYRRLPLGTLLFTVFREPVERTISLYRYFRGLDTQHISHEFTHEAVRLAKDHSILEFIYSDNPVIVEHLRLGQIRQFLSPDTLARVGHRGHLTRDLAKIVEKEFKAEINKFDFVLTTKFLNITIPEVLDRVNSSYVIEEVPNENISYDYEINDRIDIRKAVVDINPVEFSCFEYVLEIERNILIGIVKKNQGIEAERTVYSAKARRLSKHG